MSSYLNSIKKQFGYYKLLGDKTFEQLNDQDIHWQLNEDSNSVSIIVKHIVGNLLSRWTNFLTEDGEKQWRERDQEFEDTYLNKEALIAAWEKGWQCLFNALESLTNKDLEHIIYIRNQGHTVTEAINRQLSHYAYHIGQIVFVGKMIKNENWKSLSVPKGQSSTYNKEKFSKDKERKHFTDDL
ncbi:hypothetical protein MNBD_BACTEROID02-1668 [hydrothermal vent metagenome]|uniref:DUF1572 domain-containing protein n=1 Tax=hydrothermal vent metagenome TaxID=652676 RepID=A0A3B0RJF2_9ZZZZ